MGYSMQNRKTAALLLAATAGVVGLGASTADASLIMDVRAVSAAGMTIVNPHSVVPNSPGDTVTLAVFARVSGTNGINDETFQSAGGGLRSVGGVKGNITGGVVAPFNGASSTNGSVQDIDSDGDLDLGSTGSTSTGKLFGRANALVPVDPTADPNTGEIQIAQATFTFTGGGIGTDITYLVRTNATGGPNTSAALWIEDSSTANSNPSGSVFAAGQPVHIFPDPEPSSLGLLSIASIGLLTRRRHRPAPAPCDMR